MALTNKKYFESLLGYAPSADEVEGALTDVDINGDSLYNRTNSNTLKTAALSSLKRLLSTPDISQGTGETTNQIKYDRNAILRRISQLEEEIGLVLVEKKLIKNATFKW